RRRGTDQAGVRGQPRDERDHRRARRRRGARLPVRARPARAPRPDDRAAGGAARSQDPQGERPRGPAASARQSGHRADPGGGADVVERGRGFDPQLPARRQRLRAQAGRLRRVLRGGQAARHVLAADERDGAVAGADAGEMSAPRILLVEDSDDDALLVRQEIERAFGEVECARVETAEAFLAALRERELELIVCDHRLPTFSSTQALALLAASGLDVPLIIVSGSIGEERAVRAMRSGAADYILKNNLARLGPAIERELRDAAERRERRRVEAALRAEQERFRRIIETSHEGIWTVDAEARTTFVKARMRELIGHTPTELT